MKIIYSPQHHLRQPKTELHGGELVTPFECRQRVDYILKELARRDYSTPLPENIYSLKPVLAVHDKHYVDFLSTVWQHWCDAGYKGEAIPNVWPARSMRSDIVPEHIEGQLGYYALASESSITRGTWEAALAAKDVALTAADLLLKGDQSAFALCRPPGHHAASNQFGGYCFLNNAAIAAQHLRDQGAARVVCLDVDFHHGNGTQQIFYQRDDVMTISLHGDPAHAFPYFLGYADETGTGKGKGFTHNYPLPPAADYVTWGAALGQALDTIQQYDCDYLVVSLGVDTYENDPISFFKLTSDDFFDYGKRIGALGIPTLFVMEGGYAVEEIGINTANVLDGFQAANKV
ncbi:histone deacetylase family protein [Aestuariirhabdus sp. Z084]|uniref:histone deacetylase family protein n=1 Tax=Aestuariirhabdus haliotis TaxID=2918751 RepID=UPI00201B4449|nr:histone deacetylase family protein [Aestuariirhabdus haliotis]MCL6415714.1 histone deacetylase family protein [Aestuariirhabdus haliotis]MCL6419760.1 histone deacetylase family protein [Aestuariirhabdus haliotis]